MKGSFRPQLKEGFVIRIRIRPNTPIRPKPVSVRYLSEWSPGTGGGRTRGGEGAQDAQDWTGRHRGHQDWKQAAEQTFL